MTLWALEWSEVISNARSEMQLVRDHLKRKSEELTISDYLRETFPDVLDSLKDPERPVMHRTGTTG